MPQRGEAMRALRFLFSLVIIAMLGTACVPGAAPGGGRPGSSDTPKRGGTLYVSTLGGAPKVLHPYPEPQNNTSPLGDASTLMWGSLINIDYNTLDFTVDPTRSMAREMPRVSSDGRVYTFTLRDDVKWSDNRPITTEDILFTYDSIRKPENNCVCLDDVDRIDSVRALDAKSVEVTLKEPLARFLGLGTAAIGPVPKHVWEGKPWLDPAGNPEVLKPSVVSGPYLPKELGAERHSYVRNPNYWGKQPNIDEIVFVGATPSTTLELLKTGQVQWAQNFPPSQYAEAKRLRGINVVEWAGAIGTYRLIEFNLKRPPLSDKRVREALIRALNRADFVQFEDDLAVPQYSFMTQGNTRWVNNNVEHFDFDLNRARQLLQEAGYRLDGSVLRDQSGQQVRLDIVWPTTSQPRGKMATYMQQQWRQIGVEASVTGLDFNAFVDKVQRGKDFDVAMGAFGGGIDPDDVKSQIKTDGTQNVTGYSNARVDQLIEQGAVEQDERRRKEIYDEMQRIVVDDLAVFNLITTKSFTAFDQKVKGVSPLKGGDILTSNNLQVVDWYISE
jgi:peptide/nickel transport system substrate-binding protein